MRHIKIKISDRLHRKLRDASNVVGASTDLIIRELLEQGADFVLGGSILEVDTRDFEKFKTEVEVKQNPKPKNER